MQPPAHLLRLLDRRTGVSGAAADLLIGALPGAPILTVNGAAELTGRTYQATNEASVPQRP